MSEIEDSMNVHKSDNDLVETDVNTCAAVIRALWIVLTVFFYIHCLTKMHRFKGL